MKKVFGIGWARTGTTTLGECLKILGYDHQSKALHLIKDVAKKDLSRIMALAEKKDSFEDWPWIILYRELDQAFPHSRFILTKRTPEKWFRSYKNMLDNEIKVSDELNEMRRILYGLPFPHVDEKQLIQRYERHNQKVISYFSDRPEDLLIHNWEEGDGWSKLCRFLGRDIPDMPFPHANKGWYVKNPAVRRVFHFVKSILP